MFLEKKRQIQFEAICTVLVPHFARMNNQNRADSFALLNNFLEAKDKLVLAKIALFLNIIDLVSFCYGIRPFRHLPTSKKIKVMNFFFDSPIPLLRKGFWGINTLAKMSVYGQTSIYPDIGYKVRPVGIHL